VHADSSTFSVRLCMLTLVLSLSDCACWL